MGKSVLELPEAMGSAQAEAGIRRGGDDLVIGLVNNMPDAAIRTTERQFRALLSATSFGRNVQLRTFFLPEVPRSEVARSHLMQNYAPVSELFDSAVDGLIVTGAEPKALTLTDEPYWETLTKLVDWAERHTISTIWSCLAAHATVRHLDGIDRRVLDKKLFGVFDCQKVEGHPLLAGVPSRWRIPHSRHNGLPEDLLGSLGYRLLSTSAEAGADVFIRERGSLFVFLHGHTEYHVDALFREYRRDVIRFLSGEQDSYPDGPEGYFADDTATMLQAFRQRAVENRSMDLVEDLPVRGTADERLPHAWRDVAERIFHNWLSYLIDHRTPSASRENPCMQPNHADAD